MSRNNWTWNMTNLELIKIWFDGSKDVDIYLTFANKWWKKVFMGKTFSPLGYSMSYRSNDTMFNQVWINSFHKETRNNIH